MANLALIQWEQPRATAVSYASVVAFILAARFLPLLRWVFKLLYLALGCELVLVSSLAALPLLISDI